MAPKPARHLVEQAPQPEETVGDVRVEDEVREGHEARVRASLDWALVEYAGTLEKLAK
jgi:hypothetical protein